MFTSRCLPLAAAVTALALLAGCANNNPYDTQSQSQGGMSKTAKYGGLGAAVAGAAAAGYGYYADKQEAELRRQMEGTGVEVQRQGDDIKLIMPGNITFATDSANIAPSFYAPLNNLANSFKQYNQNTIEIVGYTDSTGSRQHNMDLSQRRAQSVAGYLTAQGVDGTRLSTRGMGPDQPIASNSTADGRAQNRRVEVNLRPVPGAQGPAQTQPQY
ncbi:OmpA family protein [Pseudomonas aeruginosa]|nr:OmpA family protein [Pseudomonas aeruginosa]